MALANNAVMVFTDYAITDDGIGLHFVCGNPGAGQPSDYTIELTDTELAGVVTALALKNLATDKLNRKFRSANIASKLDAIVGQSITI